MKASSTHVFSTGKPKRLYERSRTVLIEGSKEDVEFTLTAFDRALDSLGYVG